MDHISDSFLETNVPLLVLIEAAKSGNEKEVKEYAQVFREHANKLVEVSNEYYTFILTCCNWSHRIDNISNSGDSLLLQNIYSPDIQHRKYIFAARTQVLIILKDPILMKLTTSSEKTHT